MGKNELNELIVSLMDSDEVLRKRCFALFCDLGDERAAVHEPHRGPHSS